MKKQAVIVMDQFRKSLEREQAALRQAQEAFDLKEFVTANALRAAERESYMLYLMTDASQDMAGILLVSCRSFYFLRVPSHDALFSSLLVGSFMDAAAEEERVNARVDILLQLAHQNGADFWADEDRTRHIVQFQDRATQIREFHDFFGSTLSIVYNAMFSQNPQPGNLTELMGKFRYTQSIHDFAKAQMVAGAKFALIWLKVCHSKLDFSSVIDTFYRKTSKRRVNVDTHNAVVSSVAEKMIDELLRVDANFFKEFRYDDSTQNVCAARENITIDKFV
jgi:hypothetical protein